MKFKNNFFSDFKILIIRIRTFQLSRILLFQHFNLDFYLKMLNLNIKKFKNYNFNNFASLLIKIKFNLTFIILQIN